MNILTACTKDKPKEYKIDYEAEERRNLETREKSYKCQNASIATWFIIPFALFVSGLHPIACVAVGISLTWISFKIIGD